MSGCDFDLVLYFYDEMPAAARASTAAHLHGCAECRQRLEELEAIRQVLASRPAVEAPPAGDWSGFMRRLDAAVSPIAVNPDRERPLLLHATKVASEQGPRRPFRLALRHIAELAALVALVTIAVFAAARYRAIAPAPQTAAETRPAAVQRAAVQADAVAPAAGNQSLREGSVEHLERSKLVVLGLTSRDPRQTTAADWQYERRLAESLLSDTRLYRIAAQDRGVADVARVMRDLETVLLEASLSDSSDRHALERVQQLIAKRDLVMKMQVMATTGAGL